MTLWRLIEKAAKASNESTDERIMSGDDRTEELEPGVLALGAAYIAILLMLIVWLAA